MPQALPFIALGLAAAGTTMSVAGQLRQAGYQKDLADRNARTADMNATVAANRGQAEREQLTLSASQLISRQRAAAGRGGADVQDGSVLDVLSSTRFLSQSDLNRSQYNTDMERRGYAVQRENFNAQGDMAQMAGAYGAAGSLLTGLGSMAGTAYSMKGAGWGSSTASPDYTGHVPGVDVDSNLPIYDPRTFPKIGG